MPCQVFILIGMHSSNGLYLCSYSSEKTYLVCNFTTQTFTILPQHPPSDHFHNHRFAYLVFDPSKTQPFKVVLLDEALPGHNHEDEYKGITGFCNSRYCYKIDVYSSETRVWKRVYRLGRSGLHDLGYKVVCNGSIHWIAQDRVHGRFEVDTSNLIFNYLPRKPKILELKNIRYFGESCGHLFLICIPRRSTKVFCVFELDSEISTLTMKYHVDLNPLMASFPDSFRFPERNGIVVKSWNFSVLYIVKEDESDGSALLLALPGIIVSYNLNKNTFRVLKSNSRFPRLDTCYQNSYAFPFMANLTHL